MSFRACYAVIDAWQRATKFCANTVEWVFLLWLARNLDDKSLTVLRSQDRLGDEIARSGRTMRTCVQIWRDRGVLQVLEHGGGRSRKPARYRIDLENLRIYAMRCEERATAEAVAVPELAAKSLTRKPKASGVEAGSPEAHAVPEFGSSAPTSGVGPLLRKSEATFEHYSGSPCTSDSSESSSEKIISKEKLPLDSNQPLARPLTRSPKGRLAGASGGSVVVGINSAIQKLLEAGNSDEDVSRILRSRGVTIDDVRSARAKP